MNSISLSVIVCCYKSEKIITKTLGFLSRQSFKGFWELIIVDNHPEGDLEEFVQNQWKICQPPPNVNLRLVKEYVPGLSNARKAGILAAKGDVSIFCDDDNLLDRDYLSLSFDIMNNNPKIGVLGGRSILKSEEKEPYWFSSFQSSYAVGCQAVSSGDVTERGYLWGAGQVLRVNLLKRLYNGGIKHLFSDRNGKSLSSGGDWEISFWIKFLGYKLWYDERLILYHNISPERLTKSYFTSLQKGLSGSSSFTQEYKKISLMNSSIWRIRFKIRRILNLSKKSERMVLENFRVLNEIKKVEEIS